MSNRARLIFNKPDPGVNPEPHEVPAEDVAALLSKHGVSTVVINACRSAAGANEASNIASLLVQEGLKNAIGMSFNVLSLSADQFMKDFYKTFLGQDATPMEAVTYARGQLRQYSARTTKFNTQVDLEDHLVPQIHCQESEIPDTYVAQPKRSSEQPRAESYNQSSALIGREGDILRLEWLLSHFERTRIHLQGSPGVGKTSLLREAAAWWQKTGLFQHVAYVQLTDLQFQDCTNDKILAFVAKQLEIFNEDQNPGALTTALNKRSYLLVLDSMDSIAWSSNMSESQRERQLCLCLRKLKSCSIVVSSRTPDAWLDTAIQSRILLHPVSFSSSITIGTTMLEKLDVLPEKLVTLDDHSFFEQLIGLSACNPLAIKLLMHDLANEFAKDPTTSLLAHLMGLFRLRPISLDVERLSIEGGARAVRELLEWIYEESQAHIENLQRSEHMFSAPQHETAFISFDGRPNGFETLQRAMRTLGLGTEAQCRPAAQYSSSKQDLRNMGLHPAMTFVGFWHHMPHSLEPFTSALASLMVARRKLDPIEFEQFRQKLCESTEESAKSPRYLHNILRGKEPFGLAPEAADHCASAAIRLSFEVRQALSKRLSSYVDGDVVQKFGEEGYSFTRAYYSIDPLLTIVSQCSIVSGIWPQSLTHDVEIARGFAYRRGIGEWASCMATASGSPFNNALKLELDYDFYNYLCLTLSYQQLDSWPSPENWHFQYVISQAGITDSRRVRLLERVHHQFISMGVKRLRQIRHKYQNPVNGGYDLESQDKGKKDWHVATELEFACFTVMLRAVFCNTFLRKPQDDYLSQLKYIVTRPMLLVSRYMDPDVRKLAYHSFAYHKRLIDCFEGGKGFDLVTAQDRLKDLVSLKSLLKSLQGEIFGSSISIKDPEASLPLPAQLSELELTSLGGQDMLLFRANRVINRLGTGRDLNDTDKLTKAIEESKTLLLEEVESSNDPQIRFQLHNNLAFLYDRVRNKALAVQHRTTSEELKGMLDPGAIEQIEKNNTLWKPYFRDARRAKGEPVNEAESLVAQLHEQKAKLETAEADEKREELTVLACVDDIADTLRHLERKVEAVEHYQRVIEGRQRLLPANDKVILQDKFARSKLLGQMGRYDESIPTLRALVNTSAPLEDHKFYHNVKGTLGLQIMNSLVWSSDSLTVEAREEQYQEAKTVMEEDIKVKEELYEPDDVNIAIGLSNLASLHAYKNDYNKAETLYKSAIQAHLTRTTYAADRSLVWCRNNLAILWRDMEKFHDAEALHASLLKTCIEHYEMWHDTTLIIMGNVHKLYTTMGAQYKARSLIQDYLARFDEHLVEYVQKGKVSAYEEQRAKCSLGMKLTSCKLYEDAIPMFLIVAPAWRGQETRKGELIELLTKLRYCFFSKTPPQYDRAYEVGTEIVAIQTNWKGPQHADTLDTIATGVICLRKANRTKEAIKEQLSLIEVRKATLGPENNTTLGNISYLAAMYEENEDWPAAINTREEVYTTRKGMDSKSRETASALSHLAVTHADSEDYVSASDLRRDEVFLWREIEGDEGSNTNLTLFELAFTLEKVKKYEEAMVAVDKVIAHHAKAVGPLHHSTLHARILKAVILRGQRKFTEAEAILHEILAARMENPTQDTIYCRALASLSRIYEARGLSDRAVEWMNQAVEACEALSGDTQPKLPLPETLHMDLAKLFIAAKRWNEAKRVLERAIGRLQALQMTAGTVKKIGECNEMLREIGGRHIDSRG